MQWVSAPQPQEAAVSICTAASVSLLLFPSSIPQISSLLQLPSKVGTWGRTMRTMDSMGGWESSRSPKATNWE